MELSFKTGNYDQFMNMVNASKQLLNDSIILRSIKDNVDQRIDLAKDVHFQKTDLNMILVLALPLSIVLAYVNYQYGLSWRLIPLIGLVGFFIAYRIFTKNSEQDNRLLSQDIHDDSPRPLKYLGMKVDYLSSITQNRKTSLQLVRTFYIIFFPFLSYFIYEIVIGAVPFDHIFIGLVVAYILSGFFWYFFFKKDFSEVGFSESQLSDYKNLITQHYTLLSNSEEEE